MMATNGSATQPTCQNCQTSTTPLWRRDEFGAVLCNACGLFLKLHGRPRPISLKTDVIKSRNRVKTMRPDLAPKKKQQQQQQAQNFVGTDPNGDHNVAVAAAAAAAARRTSQKSLNGNHDGLESPISRTGTPSMYNQSLPTFIVDDPYHTGFGTADGRAASPITGDRNMDAPQTNEQLIAHNSSLKTRVNELELINELVRGRLDQLENEASRGPEAHSMENAQLKEQIAHLSAQLDDSHRRENSLKRRSDELELENTEYRLKLEESEVAREALARDVNSLRGVPEMGETVDMEGLKAEEAVQPEGQVHEAMEAAEPEHVPEPIEALRHADEPLDDEPPAKRPRLEEEAPVEEPSEVAPTAEAVEAS
jgi:GATA-binding protein